MRSGRTSPGTAVLVWRRCGLYPDREKNGGRDMNSYTHMLVLLVILGTLIMAKTAVRFAKRADVFRRIAVEYR